MSLTRRHFLLFFGASITTAACGKFPSSPTASPTASPATTGSLPSPTNPSLIAAEVGFSPVRGPMPLLTDGLAASKQLTDLSRYEVRDDLVLPDGFTYDVLAAWGDKVGDSRFGYNNDYLSFVPTGKDEGLLTVNFEYVNQTWLTTFEQVIGKKLPVQAIQSALAKAGKYGINAYGLPKGDALRTAIESLCKEALTDQGIGVIGIKRNVDGKWTRSNSPADRRITGISGLEDGRYLKATGPGVAIFRKTSGQGYIDGLGDKIIGTMQNCAGGTTPWGTVLSAEENFQEQVQEQVFADGTALPPASQFFDGLGGLGNVFGLAGNKYGWMVELDPTDPNDYGTKHTWLGRYRHEAVGIRVESGKPLAFYSGCDRRGGHLYKFVSKDTVKDPQAKSNSQLLADGMLYVAKFNPDGTGKWLALNPSAAIDPVLPSQVFGKGDALGIVPLPDRPNGGFFVPNSDEKVAEFRQRFKTLADLYDGTPEEKQGAILIDAHFAANAIGATCTARPEDTEIAPDGSLFIAFTSGSAGSDGGPDKAIFKGKGNEAYEYGWVMHLTEDNNAPNAQTFTWEMAATGGEPSEGGLGFANPDNLAFDPQGNLWVVTDMSTGAHNQAVPRGRVDDSGNPLAQRDLLGLYGNNSIWFIPTKGNQAGQAFLFGIGPMETETTGPYFTADGKTLFLAIQHPGEVNGTRKDMATETRKFAMKAIDGKEFLQERQVPIGSNWPSKKANDPPKPAVVAVRHTNNQTFTA